ncbi:MAG TPA: metallophosphoesterase [Noviherbaspirillum sp.]|uniref:metallophosphoesterase n=1 Tax=Noviherbaspirillum sp. TaxID=1926288 RepID=UPI002B46A342|nr:metallophosphoesterase [Noviherbaspirillum sp.]HJV87506.1 metallophosphoesterase [Noviherbaspirillum sp.]
MKLHRSISIAFALLAALHLYIGWRILPALPIGHAWRVVGGILLLASLVLVPMGLLARTIKRQPLADRLAWAGLLALGLFSSLFVLTFLRDAGLLLAAIFGAQGDALVRWSAIAVPSLAFAVTLIGFLNARRLAPVVDVEIPIANLPEPLHGFTIAQITDIHVGPTIKHGYLDAIVQAVNRLDADLIAVTGDLVDGSVRHLAPHTQPLAKLSARHGAYFVTGNHEYYSNAHDWIEEVRRLGLKVLMNEHVVLDHDGAPLLVAGVTDYTAHHFDESHRSDPHAALAGAPRDVAAKILLAHQPRSATAAAGAGFDLQLSGHTHGGQFFPWNFFVPMQQPYTAGLNRLGRLWVYTSRGTGYWGPPKRFGAPSEITRVRLVPVI